MSIYDDILGHKYSKSEIANISARRHGYPTSGAPTVEDVAAAYAKRLEPFVLEHPDQWAGWDWLVTQVRPVGETNCAQRTLYG